MTINDYKANSSPYWTALLIIGIRQVGFFS